MQVMGTKVPDTNYNDVIRSREAYNGQPTQRQSGVPTMTLPLRPDATFEQNVLAVELLFAYAHGGPAPDDNSLPQLSEAYRQYIKTEPGQRDVATWTESFRDTYADLLLFKSALTRNDPDIKLGDLAKVNTAMETMFHGLAKWLGSSPELMAS